MATVDRQSLREEFERLKAEFGQLSAIGQDVGGKRALFNALLMLFEVLMAIFMEKTTAKGSRNSSIPPSQTSKDETAATRPGGKCKCVTQNDARSRHSRTVTTTEVAAVDACANCGADLGSTPSQSKPRRTRIDILFEKVVHHVDAQVKDCPRCRQRTTAQFPADMCGPLQYGNGLKAYMMNLLIARMVTARPGAEVGRDADRCGHFAGDAPEVRDPIACGAGTLGGDGHRRTAAPAGLERR